MGDAEGWRQVSRQSSVDIVDDRRSHPRRFSEPERPSRLPAAVYGRSLACHRRLAVGYERHTSLYVALWPESSGAVDRTRADPYPRPHRQPSEGDRQLQARALLGASHRLSRHDIYGNERQVHIEGRGRRGLQDHRRQAVHGDEGGEKRREGTATAVVRPDIAAGGL